MQSTAVVMAVYHPNPDFLDQQIRSVAAQIDTDVILYAVIADTVSQDLVKSLCRHAGLTFVSTLPATPQTTVDAFEMGLKAALDGPCTHIALCDQDDIWHPDRLQQGLSALVQSGAAMVHSDASVIDADGSEIAPSVFKMEHRKKTASVADLLYLNTVTGMTVLLTRQLAQQALPFPKQDGTHFYHDLWLALVARAQDGLAFVDKPLVRYRKHGGNVVGPGVNRQSPGFAERMAAYALSRYLATELHSRFPAIQGTTAFRRSIRLGLPHAARAISAAYRRDMRRAQIASWACLAVWARWIWAIGMGAPQGVQNARNQFDTKVFALSPGCPPTPRAQADQPTKRRA
ncbi:MAG: glycosyltransferase, partial [Pseudomonadota bacterium]